MSLAPEILFVPPANPKPSSTITKLPWQQTSSFLRLPYDILSYIVDELSHEDGFPDDAALSALALTSSVLLDMCRRILFRTIEFNTRRIGMPERVKSFVDLLGTNPYLQKNVQTLFFGDNTFYPSLLNRNAYVVCLEEVLDRSRYYSHFDMDNDTQNNLLDDQIKDNDCFSEALKRLTCLKSVEISFFYANFDWGSASLALREGLTNLVKQPNLRSLRIQGLLDIPVDLLLRFKSLEELHIGSLSILQQDLKTLVPAHNALQLLSTPTYTLANKDKLRIISLGNIGCSEIQFLLDIWKHQSDEPGFVDMSCPGQVELSFCQFDNLVNLRQLIGDSAAAVRNLNLDTSEISFAVSMPLSSEEDDDFLLYCHDYSRLQNYLPTMQTHLDAVSALNNLESLEVNMAYWERSIPEMAVRPDEELRWALKLLESIPSGGIKEITLKIKLGGYSMDFPEAFSDFNSDQEFIWNDWVKEFHRPKYRSLQKFTLMIYAMATFDYEDRCTPLTQSIIDRAVKQLDPAFKGRSGDFKVECGIVDNYCLAY